MTFDEFVRRLDKSKPFYKVFVEDLADIGLAKQWHFERKSKNLIETVSTLLSVGAPPVVDKRLGMVIGPNFSGAHEMIRGLLWCYHEGTFNDRLDAPEYADGAERYMQAGLGYYFSTMNRRGPNIRITYRPDRFDKDLFEHYQVNLDEPSY